MICASRERKYDTTTTLPCPGPSALQHSVGERQQHSDQQRGGRLAVANRPHVLGDHAVGLALEGQQRAPDDGDGALRPLLDLGRCRGRLRMPAGERVGADTDKVKAEHDGEASKDQQAAAGHQLVSQLSTMVMGLTMP
jgi:hypothetical protein